MEFLNAVLPILLYFLLSILIIILIVLALKLIRVIDKFEIIANDVNKKIKSLNIFFSVIDSVSDKISLISDKMVIMVTNLLSKLFKRKEDNNE